MFSILLVFAHPDDESFVCGASVALYCRLGHKVSLVCSSRAEAGREKELRQAASILGIRHIYFLDFPGRLSGVKPEKIKAKLKAVFDLEKPQIVITWGEPGVTGPSDRVAVSRFARQLFLELLPKRNFLKKLYQATLPQKIARAIAPDYRGLEVGRISTLINIESSWYLKKQALKAYASQKAKVEKFLGLSQRPRLKEVKRFEYFKRIYPEWLLGTPQERSLLDGLSFS